MVTDTRGTRSPIRRVIDWIVLCVAIIFVLVGWVGFALVRPRFSELFAEMNVSLPGPTKVVLGVPTAIFYLLGVAFSGVLLACHLYIGNKRTRDVLEGVVFVLVLAIFVVFIVALFLPLVSMRVYAVH